jgi:hypothetical protein
MLSTLATEALATLEEAERLLAALPPGTPDHESVALLALDLREICARLADTHGSASANVARARETIYGARAGFRVIRTRQERNGSN